MTNGEKLYASVAAFSTCVVIAGTILEMIANSISTAMIGLGSALIGFVVCLDICTRRAVD